MKLDRNSNPSGVGKYALIKLRNMPEGYPKVSGSGNEFVTVPSNCVDFGDTPDTEFFVIRLKDKYAERALLSYALAAMKDDPEYGSEIKKLSDFAAVHPNKRKPD